MLFNAIISDLIIGAIRLRTAAASSARRSSALPNSVNIKGI